jgi:hypothetical protein
VALTTAELAPPWLRPLEQRACTSDNRCYHAAALMNLRTSPTLRLSHHRARRQVTSSLPPARIESGVSGRPAPCADSWDAFAGNRAGFVRHARDLAILRGLLAPGRSPRDALARFRFELVRATLRELFPDDAVQRLLSDATGDPRLRAWLDDAVLRSTAQRRASA